MTNSIKTRIKFQKSFGNSSGSSGTPRFSSATALTPQGLEGVPLDLQLFSPLGTSINARKRKSRAARGDMTEKTFSLIITNYPCPSKVTSGPVHEIKIVPGRQVGAYFVGNHKQCSHWAENFRAEYREHCDNSDSL